MSLKVQHEFPEAGLHCWPLERCCFCRRATPYWCVEKDVAVCPTCASTRDLDEVPTKAEWCGVEAKAIVRVV